MTKLLLLLLLL